MNLSPSIFENPCIKVVESFHELVKTPFSNGVNALCWSRVLEGDFAEVVDQQGSGEGFVTLDEDELRGLELSKAGRLAVEVILADRQRLLERDLDPEINCIHAYLRDASSGPVATDVFSFHVDSATAEIDTWLCTYHGAPSEGLNHDEALRRVDIPATRAELQRLYGGEDDEGFSAYLAENCYDLHYASLPRARPYSFGVGNLWRIATAWPGSPVPPCIHRAPETRPGDTSRLLLIS